MPKKGKKGGSVEVNFKGVEAGGRVPEDGTYILEVTEVEQRMGEDSGEPYLSWEFQVVQDKKWKGCKVWHNTSLQPQALFNLRGLLEALGVEVPDGKMDLDLEEYVGMTLEAELASETRKGKKRANIVEFIYEKGEEKSKSSGKKDDDDDDDDDKKKSKKKKKYEPSKGDRVKFTDDDKEEQEGKVVKIDGDTLTVKVGKEEWELEVDEVEPVD